MQRQRLPRGRSGKARNREDALKARICRLESVVTQLQSVIPDSNDAGVSAVREDKRQEERKHEPDLDEPVSSRTAPTSESKSSSGDSGILNRLVAPTFWTELSDAVAGLRDALEDTKQEEDSTPESLNDQSAKSDPASGGDSRRFSSNAVLFASLSPDQSPAFTGWLAPATKTYLLTTYRERVDPVVKGTHWPSVPGCCLSSLVTSIESLAPAPRYLPTDLECFLPLW